MPRFRLYIERRLDNQVNLFLKLRRRTTANHRKPVSASALPNRSCATIEGEVSCGLPPKSPLVGLFGRWAKYGACGRRALAF